MLEFSKFQFTTPLIIVGEHHGVQQNAFFVHDLVNSLFDQNQVIQFVAFEYPQTLLEEFLKAVKENAYENLVQTEWGKILENDGRFSIVHFELLRFLVYLGIKIVFMDEISGYWDERDRAMANNIRKELESGNPGKVIIITGNIHSKTQILSLEGKQYRPLGSYFLPEESTVIELKYHGGTFFNTRLQVFSESPLPTSPVEIVNATLLHYHLSNAVATKEK